MRVEDIAGDTDGNYRIIHTVQFQRIAVRFAAAIATAAGARQHAAVASLSGADQVSAASHVFTMTTSTGIPSMTSPLSKGVARPVK